MTDVVSRCEFTREAIQTISEVEVRLYNILNAYGKHSDEYVEALQSWAIALAQMIRLGGVISRDGELMFFAASRIAYGVIWHAKVLPGNERDPLLGSFSVHS